MAMAGGRAGGEGGGEKRKVKLKGADVEHEYHEALVEYYQVKKLYFVIL